MKGRGVRVVDEDALRSGMQGPRVAWPAAYGSVGATIGSGILAAGTSRFLSPHPRRGREGEKQ